MRCYHERNTGVLALMHLRWHPMDFTSCSCIPASASQAAQQTGVVASSVLTAVTDRRSEQEMLCRGREQEGSRRDRAFGPAADAFASEPERCEARLWPAAAASACAVRLHLKGMLGVCLPPPKYCT